MNRMGKIEQNKNKNLAKKYGKDPTLWKDVGYYLLHKSEPKYYKDEVVKHGYCKGYIVYDYVNEIMERYQHYKTMKKEEVIQALLFLPN